MIEIDSIAESKHAMTPEQPKSDTVDLQYRRIREHQAHVAEIERANQQKAKDLMMREKLLDEQEMLLKQQREAFEARTHAQKLAQQSKASLLAPILLLTCIGAGYFAYEQIGQQRQYFQQVKAAEAHVDKLTRVLGLTQEKFKESSSDVASQAQALAEANARIQQLETALKTLKATTSEHVTDETADAPNGISDNDQGASLEIVQPASELR